MQNFYSNEVDKRSLSFFVTFFKFPGKHFVKSESYITRTFTGIWSRDLVNP